MDTILVNPFKKIMGRMGSKPPILVNTLPDFNILLAICTRSGIDPDADLCRMKLLVCPNPHFRFRYVKGDSDISRARGMLATDFLNSNDDVLLMVDDDMIYEPEDAIKLVIRCFKQGYDIIGATAICKSEEKPFIVTRIFKGQELEIADHKTPTEVLFTGFGMIAIHRRVFEKIALDAKSVPLCSPLNFYPFFCPLWKEVDGQMRYLQEDYSFCQRARDAGFKVHLDTSIRIGHKGQYIYTVDDLVREKREHHKFIKYKEDFNE